MLKEIPFGLKGSIYQCPMPFSDRDPRGKLIKEFKKEKVSVVVVLAEDDEILERAGRDLKKYYGKKGFEVIHAPIQDKCVPDDEQLLKKAVLQAIQKAKEGQNIAVHCFAGRGRTGIFLCCIRKELTGEDGDKALKWVRLIIPTAVDTDEQIEFVKNYGN